jgi:hypothetical protein
MSENLFNRFAFIGGFPYAFFVRHAYSECAGERERQGVRLGKLATTVTWKTKTQRAARTAGASRYRDRECRQPRARARQPQSPGARCRGRYVIQLYSSR